jgi:hypothetical protein
MAWLLFILFLFFAWRAAAYFGQGRPQPAILSLAACALFLAGIFANYIVFQRGQGDEPDRAEAAPPAIAEAPPPTPDPPAAEPEPAPDLEGFYSEEVVPEEPVGDDPMAE